MNLYRYVLCENRLPNAHDINKDSNNYYSIKLINLTGVFSGKLIKEIDGTLAWYNEQNCEYDATVISWLEEIVIEDINIVDVNSISPDSKICAENGWKDIFLNCDDATKISILEYYHNALEKFHNALEKFELQNTIKTIELYNIKNRIDENNLKALSILSNMRQPFYRSEVDELVRIASYGDELI